MFCRSVTQADVAQIERKLMQTQEMIITKKKRVAQAEKELKLQVSHEKSESHVISRIFYLIYCRNNKIKIVEGVHGGIE